MTEAQARRLNRKRFKAARRTAKKTGGQVNATYDADGMPVYFVMPASATEDDIRIRALTLRGQKPSKTALLLSKLLDNPGDIPITVDEHMTIAQA